MIGKLRGIVDSVHEDGAVIDVGGVGYEVFCSARTCGYLTPGESAELIIETHVREDHFHLYAFMSTFERDWFRVLTSVQRVGAKVALAILSAMTPDQVANAIAAKDTTAFSRISGIGGKLAERIVAELKDKAMATPTGPMSAAAPAKGGKNAAKDAPITADSALEDTISALTYLGYSRSEAYAAAMRATREVDADTTLDERIRKTLKELAG